MIKRIEFDELGNISAIEFYGDAHAGFNGNLIGDAIQFLRSRMDTVNKHYPTVKREIPETESDSEENA